MKKTSFHILRVGLAITFLWIGVLIFKEPAAWGGYLKPWAAGLLPIPIAQAMVGTAILDIIIGFLLLIDSFVWLAALVGAIHIIIVLTVSGITDITVRDLAILSAAVSLMADSLPKKFTDPLRQSSRLGVAFGEARASEASKIMSLQNKKTEYNKSQTPEIN